MQSSYNPATSTQGMHTCRVCNACTVYVAALVHVAQLVRALPRTQKVVSLNPIQGSSLMTALGFILCCCIVFLVSLGLKLIMYWSWCVLQNW